MILNMMERAINDVSMDEPAVTDKWQRNPHDGRLLLGHTDINYDLRCKHSDKPYYHESSVRFTRASRYADTTRKEHNIEEEYKACP